MSDDKTTIQDKDEPGVRESPTPDDVVQRLVADAVGKITSEREQALQDDPPPSERDLEVEAGAAFYETIFADAETEEDTLVAFARYDPEETSPQLAEFWHYNHPALAKGGFI